jgi:hypothetical protein
MNQQPITFPPQSPSVATAETVELFNAGIAWLSVAGFPPAEYTTGNAADNSLRDDANPKR